MQAVRESEQRSKLKRNLKKNEKSSWQFLEDVLLFKSCLMNGKRLEDNENTTQKVWKTWEKYLTNEKSCDNI